MKKTIQIIKRMQQDIKQQYEDLLPKKHMENVYYEMKCLLREYECLDELIKEIKASSNYIYYLDECNQCRNHNNCFREERTMNYRNLINRELPKYDDVIGIEDFRCEFFRQED